MGKQTVHVGYGYSSGDNYRLGFQQGGVSAPPPPSYAAGGENFGNPGHMRHHIQSPIRDRRNTFGGFGGHGFGNLESGIAHGSATPYGHPVTHPGFTTMGFPGHALASQDVRNGIPRSKNVKRSVYDGEFPVNYINMKMY